MFLDLMLPHGLSLCAHPESAEQAAPVQAAPVQAAPVPAAPVPAAEVPPEEVPPTPVPAAAGRVVFTADLGVNTIAFFPRAASADLSAFVGSLLLKDPRRRPHHWAAVGLRLIGSYGSVLLNDNLDRFHTGVHMHLTVTGAAGRRGLLAYSAGLGPVFGFVQAAAAHPKPATPYGIEFEGRIGYFVEGSRSTRVTAMFGGLLRLSIPLADGAIPTPLLGLFLGLAIVPRRPTR